MGLSREREIRFGLLGKAHLAASAAKVIGLALMNMGIGRALDLNGHAANGINGRFLPRFLLLPATAATPFLIIGG